MNPQRILRQKLEDLQRAGVTHESSEWTTLLDEISEVVTSAQTATPMTDPRSAESSRVAVTPHPKATSAATTSPDGAATPTADPPSEKPHPAAIASTVPVARQFLPSSSGSLPGEFSADTARSCSSLSRDERVAGLTKAAEHVYR